MHTIIHIQKWI